MTGPFLSIQESKLYGLTWINISRIVKIQQASRTTTVFLDGAGAIQIDEPAQTLLDRIEEALAGQSAPRRAAGRTVTAAKRDNVRRKEAAGD
jgi:hypothetical protein